MSRDLLANEERDHVAWHRLSPLSFGVEFEKEVRLVVRSIPTSGSAEWLLARMIRLESVIPFSDRDELYKSMIHIARHLPAEREGELVALVQQHFGDDLDTQLDLLAAVREGHTTERRHSCCFAHSSLRRQECRRSKRPNMGRHPRAAPPGRNFHTEVTRLAARHSVYGGKPLPLVPRHAPLRRWPSTRDARQPSARRRELTGTLRSKTFNLPPNLASGSPVIAASPPHPRMKRNFVRLVDADTAP